MSWDIFPKDKIEYFLDKLKDIFDTKADSGEVEGLKTVTGNPITLTDASETYAQGLTVELEPKQDLHGYDYPWVGGAGKNKAVLKLSDIKDNNTTGTWSGNVYTINNGTITVLTDSDDNVTGFKANGTFNANTTFLISNYNIKLTEDTYIFGAAEHSNDPAGDGNGYFCFLSNINGVSTWVGSSFQVGNRTFTITNTAQQIRLGLYIASGTSISNYTFYPMIRLSSVTDDTFAPYSNICPITGYDECEVEDVGVNVWDEEWELGAYDYQTGEKTSGGNQNIRCKNLIKVEPSTTYYLCCVGKTIFAHKCFYDKDGNFIRYLYTDPNKAFTTPNNAYYMSGWSSSGITTYDFQVSVNYPSTDTNYHPHQSRTASITFGQTVYGGKVDFLTGVLKVDRAFVEFDGSSDETLSYISPWLNIGNISPLHKNGAIPISNIYKGVSVTTWEELNNGEFSFHPSDGDNIRIYDDTKTSLSQWKTYLASNPLQVCYKLAEPFTIKLTPQELKLLQDTNNLTTNGTTITLDYIPNNSIGDAVKASEEYTDRAVERVIPKATLIDTWMISEESDTISVDLTSYDCNFFLLEYLFQSKRGTTLIPRPQDGGFSASVVTYNNGSALYIELDYNPTTKQLAYTSNITSHFGVLAIYTI